MRCRVDRFLQLGGAAAGVAILAACGSDDDSAIVRHQRRHARRPAPAASVPAGSMLGDYSNVVNTASGTLAMFTWGDYNDPEIVGALAETDLGVTMKVDYYAEQRRPDHQAVGQPTATAASTSSCPPARTSRR